MVAQPLSRSDAVVRIENVVATASLNQMVDLNAVLRFFPTAQYRPEVFPGLVFRLKEPKTSTLIFGSGKMVCTGARSEVEAKSAVTKVVEDLKRLGLVVDKPEIKIQNIVASGDLRGYIDLEQSARTLDRTMYEPEQFPGLVYRMHEPNVVMLLFASGKIVCAGAKREDEVHKAVARLLETLEAKKLISS